MYIHRHVCTYYTHTYTHTRARAHTHPLHIHTHTWQYSNSTAMITIYYRYAADTINTIWKDKRNKTSFKSIFCILSTELVYNQDKKCTSPSNQNISIHLKHNCTHTLGRAHTLIHKHINARCIKH